MVEGTKRIILIIGVLLFVIGIIVCISVLGIGERMLLTLGVLSIIVGIIVCISILGIEERMILMIGVLIIVIGIIACIFISDWYFGTTLLSETLIGILIGTPLGWIGAYVSFYTVESDKKDGDGT